MADSDCRSKRVNRPPSNSLPRAKNIPHSHVPFHITPDENSMQDNVLVNNDEDALLNTRETTAYSLITGAFLRLCWCNVMQFMVMCYDVLWCIVKWCDLVYGNKNYFTRKNQMTWKLLSFYMIGWRIEFPGYATFIFSYLLIYIILVSFFCSSGRFISNIFLIVLCSSTLLFLLYYLLLLHLLVFLIYFSFSSCCFYRPSNNCSGCLHQRGRRRLEMKRAEEQKKETKMMYIRR